VDETEVSVKAKGAKPPGPRFVPDKNALNLREVRRIVRRQLQLKLTSDAMRADNRADCQPNMFRSLSRFGTGR
jgi:hypothetical protein